MPRNSFPDTPLIRLQRERHAPRAFGRRNTKRSVLLVLGLLILLPVLIFSAYELATLNAAERILASTYTRQLEGVLSSVNQYSWDVVSGWAASLSGGLASREPEDSLLHASVERHEAVDAAFLADTAGHIERVFWRHQNDPSPGRLDLAAREAAAGRKRLIKLRAAGYTRLDPFVLDSAGGDMRVALVFLAGGPGIRLAGFVLEPDRFVRTTLAPRLLEIAGTEFVIAVMRRGVPGTTFATDSVQEASITQRRTLWVFPGLEAGIRFRGTSVEELAASRSRRTLAMIVALDLVLLAGAWATYRNLRREMEFTRLKSDFVSSISHELRTPLALIRMYAEMLEMGRAKDESKRQEYYATIVAESARLTRLVNNILNFSRLEAGRMPYRFAPLDLNAVVEDVARVWEPHIRAEGIQMHVGCAAGLPAVEADLEAVTEAVVNLVDNAIKYGGEGKFLRVATAVDGGNVVLSVEDHGIGITAQHLPNIFDMFYRASGGLVQTARGSGVGLAIVKHIMGAHRGEITVRSVPGAGSTFALVFPVPCADPGKNRQAEART